VLGGNDAPLLITPHTVRDPDPAVCTGHRIVFPNVGITTRSRPATWSVGS